MSTTYGTSKGRLGAARRDLGLAREFVPEPSAEELDERQAHARSRRRGPLGLLKHDPDALLALEEGPVVAEVGPTECAEPSFGECASSSL